MKLLEAIEHRRSVGKVKQDTVEREKIEALLKLATLAPNHHMTEPWRFFVMTGEGRNVLGDAYKHVAFENAGDVSEEDKRTIEIVQQNKAKRAPVVIAASVTFRGDDKIEQAEDRAATHAAVQNILLGAHALGLGAIWRSGAPMYHPKMKEAFGLGKDSELVGLIYIGYPELEPAQKPRKSFEEVTTWIEKC